LKIPIVSRDLLVELYLNQNLSILDVSRKIGNVSNVTVRKWLNHYSIPIKTHSQAIKNSHTQKNYSAFNNPETQRKVKETFIEKYGTPYHPNMMTSNTEEEVREFFNSLGCNMTKSRVLGCELDGLDENILVAFEYCGHYWHNEHSPTPKTRQYHNQKHVQCQLHGIQLFTIFEYEWTTRKDQVKNFIRGALNKNTSKLYARECDLKIFTEKNPEINAFLDRYHIQGYPTSWFQCNALFYKQEIVGVMTFSNHHRQNQENVIVLSRLCWKTDLSVIGGSSRLFAYRPANKTIVSWSDERKAKHLESVQGCHANRDSTAYSEANKKAWAAGKMSHRKSNNMRDFIWVNIKSTGKNTRIPKTKFDENLYNLGRNLS